jgi:hypothetical protein
MANSSTVANVRILPRTVLFLLGIAVSVAMFMSLGIVKAAPPANSTVADVPDAGTVLEKLKAIDAAFETGFTVSGTEEGKDIISIKAFTLMAATRKWTLTYGGADRVGFLKELTDHESPKLGGLPGAPHTVAIREKTWGYWGRDLSGLHYDDPTVDVGPGGKEKPFGKLSDSIIYPPKAAGPLAPRWELLLSLGRFYSPLISKISRVEKTDGGRLAVSAQGSLNQKEKGRWELQIDPATAWMVRKACFYPDVGPNQIGFEMKNEGAVWSESRCVPMTAVINVWDSIENKSPLIESATKHLTFKRYLGRFDEQLYKSAEQAVAHNTDENLTVHDWRVSPATFNQPNRPKPAPDPKK